MMTYFWSEWKCSVAAATLWIVSSNSNGFTCGCQEMCHSTPMLYSCTVFYRILHFICALFQHWTGQQNEIKTRVKASKLSYFYPGVLARASVCLAFLVWRFFFGGGGGERSQTGLGRWLSPSGAWGGFQKTLPVTSGPSADSKSRSLPECFRTATPAPYLSWKCNTPRTPGAGPPRRHVG